MCLADRKKALALPLVACGVVLIAMALTARSEPPRISPHPGLEAVAPALRRVLADERADIRVLAACALVDLDTVDREVIDVLAQGLAAKDPATVSASLRGLARLGPRVQPALPAVMRVLEQGPVDQTEAAKRVVVAVGRPAVPDLKKLLAHADPKVQRRAVEVAGEMGYAAHPVVDELTLMLGAEDPLLRGAAIEAVGRIGKVVRRAEAEAARALKYARWDNKEERQQIFAQITADGAEALVDAVLNDGKSPVGSHYVFVNALAAIGRPAIPACLRLWQSDSPHYRVGAQAIAGMGGLAAPAVAPLLAYAEQYKLEEVEQCYRVHYPRGKAGRFSQLLTTLRRIGSHDLQAVRRALQSEKATVRLAAVAAFDRECLAAWDEFVKLLDDRETRVRLAALGCMWQLRKDAAPALSRLQEMLTDENPEIRRVTTEAIGQLGNAGQQAVPDLARRLFDDEQRVRSAAAGSLVRLGPPGWDAVSGLLNSDREIDRQRALEALVDFRQDEMVDSEIRERVDGAVLAAVARLLSDPGVRIQLAAARAMRAMLEDTRKYDTFPVDALVAEISGAVGERLIELASGDDAQTRSESIRCLAAYWDKFPGPEDRVRRLLAAIADGCRDETPDVRRVTLLALATMRRLPSGVLDHILVGLDDKHPDVRAAAAQALWALLKNCHPETGTQLTAPRIFGFGMQRQKLPRQDEFISKLTAMLTDEQPQPRRSAVEALGAIGGDAQSALPEVRKLAQDSHIEVRQAATKAAEWIEQGLGYSGDVFLRMESPDGYKLPLPDADR